MLAPRSSKASDPEQNRIVSIKVLPPRFSEDPELKERLEREVLALSGLSHPHICTPHEIHREGETTKRRLTAPSPC